MKETATEIKQDKEEFAISRLTELTRSIGEHLSKVRRAIESTEGLLEHITVREAAPDKVVEDLEGFLEHLEIRNEANKADLQLYERRLELITKVLEAIKTPEGMELYLAIQELNS